MESEGCIHVPGSHTIELPPLILSAEMKCEPQEEEVKGAQTIVENESMVPDANVSEDVMAERKFELALLLAQSYRVMLSHWRWGDALLEWVRQCEYSFEHWPDMRSLLRPDVWPHAGRSSFVRLVANSKYPPVSVKLDQAVGIRLFFRVPPPIDCFSNIGLLVLGHQFFKNAYEEWSSLSPKPHLDFPPDRFRFRIQSSDMSNR